MLGSNIPQIGGLAAGFSFAKEWGCECVQIYTTPSRSWITPPLKPELISEFHTAKRLASVQSVIAHVPFLVNLASREDELFRRSCDRVVLEMERAEALGVSNIVLHPGSCGDQSRSQGLARVGLGLQLVLAQLGTATGKRPKMLLETMAGQGTTLGASFEELAVLLEQVHSPWLGVCLDTAHVFAAGYDIRGRSGWQQVMKEFDSAIGIEQLGVVHVNDSKEALGSRRDRHENIGMGYIGQETFFALLTDDRLSQLPKVLETPDRALNAVHDLVTLRDIRKQSPDFMFPPAPLRSVQQLELKSSGRLFDDW